MNELLGLITKYGSLQYARERAREWVGRARMALEEWSTPLDDSAHLGFLFGVLDYVVVRTR